MLEPKETEPIEKAGKDALKELLYNAKLAKSKNENFVVLHAVSFREISFVLEQYGIDLTGWHHMVDEAALRHVVNKHTSLNEKEHYPLIESEILLIPDILTAYDSLQVANPLADGSQTMIYTKNFQGEVLKLEYVAQFRKGRKRLALKTMYKKPR